jgi:release factor glutamine methyltransferase
MIDQQSFHNANKHIIDELKLLGVDAGEAQAEATVILQNITGFSLADQIKHSGDAISQRQIAAINALLERRRRREPLQYCLNKAIFMGLEFFVEPGVFIPRMDTELLVQECEKNILHCQQTGKTGKFFHLAEIGIGSGAIAIALLKRLPALKITAFDLSEKAIEVSRKNAVTHNVNERLNFELGDWQNKLAGNFDGVVSNPPYIPTRDKDTLAPEVCCFEPSEALFGADEDGLGFYRDFAVHIPSKLNDKKGFLIVEIGDGQSKSVEDIFINKGWRDIEIYTDLGGMPRVIKATPP